MKLPDRGHGPRKPADDFVAAEEAGRLSEQATAAMARAEGVDWYEENGTAVDEAAFALARLRRAQAGLRELDREQNKLVRELLGPDFLSRRGDENWEAQQRRQFGSRAISYMDETVYPEAVEPWFQSLLDPRG